MKPTKQNIRHVFYLTLCLLLLSQAAVVHSATVTGNLSDVSLAPVNTKILFSPTNEVLVTASGLNVGPPKIIDTTNGAFSTVLDAGDYTVSLPLIPSRRPFCISVIATNGTINITNLLTACPNTNTGVPLHINSHQVVAWSTNGESSLIDTNITIPGGTLRAGRVLKVEAFGSFADPGNNFPNTIFQLKLGAMVVLSVAKPATTANWHLRAVVTFRAVGLFGVAIGSIAVSQDNVGLEPLFQGSQTATVDTSVPLTFSLTGRINDIVHTENITCEQVVMQMQ